MYTNKTLSFSASNNFVSSKKLGQPLNVVAAQSEKA